MITAATSADVLRLISELDDEGVALLRSLPAEAWTRTVTPGHWRVRDVVAHLIDGAARRLSFGRDGLAPSPPPWPMHGPADLTRFLDDLNATWIRACDRLSPRLLIDLAALTSRELAGYLGTLDPETPALFPVAWAGDAASATWFDVAREYTERWHHWMQIREAAGAPLATAPRWMTPLLGTAVYALPVAYAGVTADTGATVSLTVRGDGGGQWSLTHRNGAWALAEGEATTPHAAVAMDVDAAWRLFFKMLPRDEAERRATVTGDTRLAAPLFGALALMAAPAAP